jgi:hypothetical protein
LTKRQGFFNLKNMKKYLIPIGIVGLLTAGVFALILVVWGINTYNTAASTQNLYNMKVKDNSSEFDNMWKQISQVTQIADSKKEAFKEIFNGYATARTPEGAGKVMFWVKENAPNADLNVYDKAQNIIVSSRNGWTMRQKEMVSIATTYNDMLVRFPKGSFLKLFGFKIIDPKVITSTRTEKTFETGKDDDVSLKGAATK